MSSADTLEKVRELKVAVMNLRNAEGLASDDAARQQILSAALALEMIGKSLEARARRREESFAPPRGEPAGKTDDWGLRQLPTGDR